MTIDAISALSRAQLARLGREYMLAAQFNSRTGYAALAMNHGGDAYKEVAIDNWMAASPVYTRRMQGAMRLRGGSDVETILKGLQLEGGFSHQYFDARFRMVAREEGEFWLQRCGPLLETEPRGEAAVRVMCHDIEDPTFDATAVATNPRAQVRPIHRPPRVHADQAPHCHWRVTVSPDAEPVRERDITQLMAARRVAQVGIERGESTEPGGWDYYDGPLIEQMHLERFSQSALAVICKELAVQVHLLVASLGLAVCRRYGEHAARAVAEFQMTGSGWVISERLARCLGLEGGGVDAIVAVLRVHPAFQPGEYFSVDISPTAQETVRITLRDCPALHEQQPLGWMPLLQDGGAATPLEALIQGVEPRARLVPVDGDGAAWDVHLGAEPAEEPLAVQIAKGTVLYTTELENHIQLLEVV
jgi:putative component of membrane protein insertase Oxa1/YidC/SpoIIIJ protein YidD